jgi:hypothetical protein
MLGRSRLHIRVDEENRILVFRLIGDLEGEEVTDRLLEVFNSLDRPWEYHHLIDLRHFMNVIPFGELEKLGVEWKALCKGHSFPMKSAIITSDIFTIKRLSHTAKLFPDATAQAFATLDEGLDWLKSDAAD